MKVKPINRKRTVCTGCDFHRFFTVKKCHYLSDTCSHPTLPVGKCGRLRFLGKGRRTEYPVPEWCPEMKLTGKENDMGTVITNSCDRCSYSQIEVKGQREDQIEQMWDVYVSIGLHGSRDNIDVCRSKDNIDVRRTALWCRKCLETSGLLPISESSKNEVPVSIHVTDALIQEIRRQTQ